jgi:predicted DCC family thiol-disulfide oxidoreductase YuxK
MYLYNIKENMNIVLFDGVCNLCNTTVSFLIKHDSKNHLYFAAQQNPFGTIIMQEKEIMIENKSVIFIKKDNVYYKSDAIIEIAKFLTGWPSIIKYSWMIPKFIRDGIYDFIAKNRYRIFGKRTTCFIPTKDIQKRFL